MKNSNKIKKYLDKKKISYLKLVKYILKKPRTQKSRLRTRKSHTRGRRRVSSNSLKRISIGGRSL